MPRRQPHFYDQATIDSLKNVPLPPKIKCGRCTKWLGHQNFSGKQLTEARSVVKNQGHKAGYSINCVPCTGGQLVEIECSYCHRTKGLEAFAKVQRRKPDQAKCFACTEDQLDQDAVNDDVYENANDRSKLFAPGETAGGYSIASPWSDTTCTEPSVNDNWVAGELGGIGLSKHLHAKLSEPSSDHETLIEDDYERDSRFGSHDGWQSAQTKSWRTPSNNAPSTSSRFDPNGYGRPPQRSTSGSVNSFSSSFAERSDTISEYKNGWAKIKAHDPRKDSQGRSVQSPASKAEDDEWSSSESECGDDSDDDTEI